MDEQEILRRFKKNRRNLLLRIWDARLSYLLLAPFLLPFIVFILVPLVQSARFSLYDYSAVATDEPEYIGFANYRQLLSFTIKPHPRLFDEETGEAIYQCGRRKYPESEVAAYEAEEGEKCEVAYIRARDLFGESFLEWRGFNLGSRRYLIGAKDPRFLTALYNTMIFAFWTVIGKIILGLFLAMALQEQTRLNYFLRTIFFLPSVTASIAITVVWGWIFRGSSFGLINNILMQLGLTSEPIFFLKDADWTMTILVIMTIWGGSGYNMILFLAGLQNINAELYEVAAIDGAGPWARFTKITLPLLRPTTLYVLITSIIGAFQVFEAVYILFADAEGIGGVSDSGLTVVPYLYDEGFRLFNMGYASAVAWVLFFIIFLLTLLNLSLGRSGEAY